MSYGRSRPWGKPGAFLKQRCRKPKVEHDHTGENILYTYYRIWAYRGDCQAISQKRFVAALLKQFGEPRIIHGHRIFPVALRDPPKKKVDYERVAVVDVPLARMRILEELPFVDGAMPVGLELDKLEPTEVEAKRLKDEYQRQIKDKRTDPTTWLVVRWKGTRRRIPGSAAKSIEQE